MNPKYTLAPDVAEKIERIAVSLWESLYEMPEYKPGTPERREALAGLEPNDMIYDKRLRRDVEEEFGIRRIEHPIHWLLRKGGMTIEPAPLNGRAEERTLYLRGERLDLEQFREGLSKYAKYIRANLDGHYPMDG